jgi:uncharacterized membrane protein
MTTNDAPPPTDDPSNPNSRPPFEPHARSRRPFRSLWERHPAVPAGEELTTGERAADAMRNGMGSWAFVGAFGLFLVTWVIANSVFHLFSSTGRHGFDPYPYILLNLFLSMLAAIQGAILLIAAKRSDQIASLLAEHDYETDTHAFERIDSVYASVVELADLHRALLEQSTGILQRLSTMSPGGGSTQGAADSSQ